MDCTKNYLKTADARVEASQQAGQLPDPHDRAAQFAWAGWLRESFRDAPEKKTQVME